MRLIDADDLEISTEFSDDGEYSWDIVPAFRIHAAPTIDAVPVVRCKDCEYFAEVNGKDSGKPCGYGRCEYSFGIRSIVCAIDFCSFGERRDTDG